MLESRNEEPLARMEELQGAVGPESSSRRTSEMTIGFWKREKGDPRARLSVL